MSLAFRAIAEYLKPMVDAKASEKSLDLRHVS